MTKLDLLASAIDSRMKFRGLTFEEALKESVQKIEELYPEEPQQETKEEQAEKQRKLIQKFTEDKAEYQQRVRDLTKVYSQTKSDLFCTKIAQGLSMEVARDQARDQAFDFWNSELEEFDRIIDSLSLHIEEAEKQLKKIYS